MKPSQRRRLAKKTPAQLGRMARKKVRKEKSRKVRETEMVEHLLSSGWKRCGCGHSGKEGLRQLPQVWKIDHWKPEQHCSGFERGYMRIPDLDGEGFRMVYSRREPKRWATQEVKMTLHQAYKVQLRLDAIGFVRPKGLDDDLADLL